MIRLIREIFNLTAPYGKGRLSLLLAVMVGQVAAQTTSLFSVYLFLNILTSPKFFSQNGAGMFVANLMGSKPMNSELSWKLVAICGGAVAATVIAASAFSVWAEYHRARGAHDIGRWLRNRMVQNILARDYHYLLTASPSVLTKKVVQDVMTFVQQLLLPLFEIIVRGMFAATLMIWLLTISPIGFLFILIFSALYFLIVMQTMKAASQRLSEIIKQETREVYSSVGQTFSGLKAILAGNMQTFFIDRCDAPSSRLAAAVPRVVLLASIPKYLLEAVTIAGFVALVLANTSGGKSIGDLAPTLAIFALIMYRLAPSLQIIISQSISMNSMRQSLEEVLDELNPSESPVDDFPNSTVRLVPFTQTLRLDHVSFFYEENSRRGVNDICIEIPYGSHVSIVGRTGCGKSTLVDLIIGLLSPRTGNVSVDGKPLAEIDIFKWRNQIGYVPQEQFLLDATLSENIALGVPADKIDMEAVYLAARHASMDDFIRSELPLGYNTRVGERGLSLSGGQKQRLGIARALYRRPGLLILDEATSAVDGLTEKAIVKGLRELDFNPTVVTITHRLSTIRECDQVILLEAGAVVGQGSFNVLYSQCAQFRRLVESNEMKAPA